MTNPDSNEHIWMYKINNNIIYPILERKFNSYISTGYNLNLNKKYNLYDLLPYDNNISIYHPNEIMACELADDICISNKKSPNIKNMKIIMFS